MSIDVECVACEIILKTPGGLLFGPPDVNSGHVMKYHLCGRCYDRIMVVIKRVMS
jgi:hypothetical protein